MGPTPLKYHMRDSGETEMEREQAAAKGWAEGLLLKCGRNDGMVMIGRGKRKKKKEEEWRERKLSTGEQGMNN